MRGLPSRRESRAEISKLEGLVLISSCLSEDVVPCMYNWCTWLGQLSPHLYDFVRSCHNLLARIRPLIALHTLMMLHLKILAFMFNAFLQLLMKKNQCTGQGDLLDFKAMTWISRLYIRAFKSPYIFYSTTITTLFFIILHHTKNPLAISYQDNLSEIPWKSICTLKTSSSSQCSSLERFVRQSPLEVRPKPFISVLILTHPNRIQNPSWGQHYIRRFWQPCGHYKSEESCPRNGRGVCVSRSVSRRWIGESRTKRGGGWEALCSRSGWGIWI